MNEINTIKLTQKTLLMSVLCVASGAHASPLLTDALNEQTVYSSAAITLGASSVIGGNLQTVGGATLGANAIVGINIVAGAAVTLGAGAEVGGNVNARDAGTIGSDVTIGGSLTTGDAATLGATTIDGNIMVGGDLTAGAAILVGVKSAIGGNLASGHAGSVNLGASAAVGGNATAGTALTLGADTSIGMNAQAGTGAVALGERVVVVGTATAGTSVTVPLSAQVGLNSEIGVDIFNGQITTFAPFIKGPIDNQKEQLTAVQEKLAAIETPIENLLAATMTVDTTLEAGIYNTTALTTTAGITLTFDGKGEDGIWLINIDTFIAFGANLTMELLDVTDNSTIIFNTAGYTTVGADSNLIGAIFAGSYITTGATVALTGIGGTCGGIYTTNGAVTLGADAKMGAIGCTVGAVSNLDFDEAGNPIISSSVVPAPAALWLFGSALIGLVGVARHTKNTDSNPSFPRGLTRHAPLKFDDAGYL
ncbi:MAG: UDP-3-O-[3-hydroxymyristoyl] glucosamine N-acyltransferase [Halioglobus sp.]|jgi:MSHA biogenesis protein MshQ